MATLTFYKKHMQTSIDTAVKKTYPQLEDILYHLAKLMIDHLAKASGIEEISRLMPLKAVFLDYLQNNPHKIRLKDIRAASQSLLTQYKNHQRTPSMQGIYRIITQEMRELVISLLAECITDYHQLTGTYPPCEYAFISFGSMARGEMTPYSAFEFGILVTTMSPEIKNYFYNIAHLMHLKVLLLGETPPQMMGINLPEEIMNFIPHGFSFGAIGLESCKNPLDRYTQQGKLVFELIGTPEQLARHQAEPDEQQPEPLQEERFLANSLTCAGFIISGKPGKLCELSEEADQSLLQSYLEAVNQHLNAKTELLWKRKLEEPLFLHQTRALELLLSDEVHFRLNRNKLETSSCSYSIEHDLHRFSGMIIDQLALYFNLSQPSLWARIHALQEKQLWTTKASSHLLEAVDRLAEYRLAAYLYLGGQAEHALLDQSLNVMRLSRSTKEADKVFILPVTYLFELYYRFLPFWQAAKAFRDSQGDISVFKKPIFEDFYQNSDFIQAQIKSLLQQDSGQALEDLERLLTEPQTQTTVINNAHTFKAAGQATYALHQHAKTVYYLSQAISLYQQDGQSYATELIDCYLGLALAFQAQGETAQASTCQKQAQKLADEGFGPTHPYVARCQLVLWYLEQSASNLSSRGKQELKICWNLPADNTGYFVGRELPLNYLNQYITPINPSSNLVLRVISGLGGVGKTQLAVYYIHHQEKPYALRLWFHAEDVNTLFSDYQQFARQFKLIPTEGDTPKQEVISAVKCYLEKTPNWLAVYDNAGPYSELKDYLPSRGHLIITTRLNEWSKIGQTIQIPMFSQAEALSYLTNTLGYPGKQEEQAMVQLAELLGYLPLALAQAGAYIKKTGKTVVDYVVLYLRQSSTLLADNLPAHSKHLLPVAHTWVLNLAAIYKDEEQAGEPPLSIRLLVTMAYLHAEAIPQALLVEWLQTVHPVKNPLDAQLQLEKALGHLLDYSMIQYQAEHKTFSIHRLVQEMIRHTFLDLGMNSSEQSTATGKVHLLLNSLAHSLSVEFTRYTEVVADEAQQNALFIHMQSLLRHYLQILKIHSAVTIELASLFNHLGYVFFRQGDLQQAKKHYEYALTIEKLHYGPDNQQLASTLVHLANTLTALGDATTAQGLLQRALMIQESHYGRNHSQVATTLVHLATLPNLGNPIIKKNLLQRALSIKTSCYGPNHWQLADTLNNLADAFGELGDVITQKILLQRALTIKASHYGKYHWQLVSTLVHLANVFGRLGDLIAKKHLLQRALSIQKLHYGPNHQQVAMTLVNLVTVYLETKTHFQEALLMAQSAHAIFLNHDTNPSHPNIQKTQSLIKACQQALETNQETIEDTQSSEIYFSDAYRFFSAICHVHSQTRIKRAPSP